MKHLEMIYEGGKEYNNTFHRGNRLGVNFDEKQAFERVKNLVAEEVGELIHATTVDRRVELRMDAIGDITFAVGSCLHILGDYPQFETIKTGRLEWRQIHRRASTSYEGVKQAMALLMASNYVVELQSMLVCVFLSARSYAYGSGWDFEELYRVIQRSNRTKSVGDNRRALKGESFVEPDFHEVKYGVDLISTNVPCECGSDDFFFYADNRDSYSYRCFHCGNNMDDGRED